MPRSWCGRPRPSDERGQRGEAQEPEEISCSECFDLLSAGVELELAGATWEPGLARLGRHLGQCRVCRDEYETLRDFVRVEAESASDQKQRRRGMTAMIRPKRGYARAALSSWLKGVAPSAERCKKVPEGRKR